MECLLDFIHLLSVTENLLSEAIFILRNNFFPADITCGDFYYELFVEEGMQSNFVYK